MCNIYYKTAYYSGYFYVYLRVRGSNKWQLLRNRGTNFSRHELQKGERRAVAHNNVMFFLTLKDAENYANQLGLVNFDSLSWVRKALERSSYTHFESLEQVLIGSGHCIYKENEHDKV